MNGRVAPVRETGIIGVVGVFVPEDPKAADKLAKQGQIAFDPGKFFEKGLRIGSAQANVKSYSRRLRNLIDAGPRRRSSSCTSSHWIRRPMRINISTPARKAGRKSC